MIYNITDSLEANPGAVFSKHECDVETWSLQDTNTEKELCRRHFVSSSQTLIEQQGLID